MANTLDQFALLSTVDDLSLNTDFLEEKVSIPMEIENFQNYLDSLITIHFEKKEFRDPENQHIWRNLKKYILNGGKRIRPYIINKLWSEDEKNEEVLLAVEFLHNSTLILDDYLDEHSTRRSQDTLHIKIMKERNIPQKEAEKFAILYGRMLEDEVLGLIYDLNTISKTRIEILKTCYEIDKTINIAQYMDQNFTNILGIEEEQLLLQSKYATSFLLKSMFNIGTLSRNQRERETWDKIGYNIGMSFQMIDDLMDMSHRSKKGRALGDDIRNGKPTPLTTFAYNKLNAREQIQFQKIFGKQDLTENELLWAIDMCQKTGATRHTRSLANKFADNTHMLSNYLQNSEEAEWIREFQNHVITRTT